MTFSRFVLALAIGAIALSGLRAAAPVTATLSGPARPAVPPPPTIIDSDTATASSTNTETTYTFDGHVKVTGNDISIDCEHLVVIATRLGDKSATLGTIDQFKSLVATGHVRIVQGDRESTSGRADVFPREEKMVLTQDPVVIDHLGPYKFTGEPITLLRGERRVFGEHIKITLPPVQDLGFGADAPMKPPAAVPNATPTPTPVPSK